MSTTDRKRFGTVYTPRHIVDLILDNVLSSDYLDRTRVYDPACGDGAFLVPVAERILSELPRSKAINALRLIAGSDIDEQAIGRCKERLDRLVHEWYPAENITWDINQGDVLDRVSMFGKTEEYDVIVGNPPYVRIQHLEETRRNYLKDGWEMIRGAADLYIVFFEFALNMLKPGGMLGYITPSSWLHSDAGTMLRHHFTQKDSLRKIVYFGQNQVFPEVTAYTAITIAERTPPSENYVPVDFHNGDDLLGQGFALPENADPWTLYRSEDALDRMIEMHARGVPLGEVADIRVGIQTLADRVFILPKDEAEALRLESWILRDIVKASVMKDGIDPVDRKIIFPYDDEANLMPEQHIADMAPNVYRWLVANKETLLNRDKGKSDPEKWYGYGRSVSILSGFGDKLITSGMNQKPNFQRCANTNATFYSGYCVKLKPDSPITLDRLMNLLNSDDMEFFIEQTSKPFQSGWMSYSKSFIERFPVKI